MPSHDAEALNPTADSTATFMFMPAGALLSDLGCLHEEREQTPQPKNVDELGAVLRSLRTRHGMIQHLEGAVP